MANKKTSKVRDLKPTKDAKGGGKVVQGNLGQGSTGQGSTGQGTTGQGHEGQRHHRRHEQ